MKENSEGNRFKVGDRVRIARVDPMYKGGTFYTDYIEMIGMEAVVRQIYPDGEYSLKDLKYHTWRESELEPAKEAQVLEILRAWRSSR